MPRRIADISSEKPSQEESLPPGFWLPDYKSSLVKGELLRDIFGNAWTLGKSIGIGGFGQIFLVGKGMVKEVKNDTPYVCKVESHSSGPLFVEINCYLRIAKPKMIDSWRAENKVENLGMPYYISSGSHTKDSTKYRFLIIPRFEKDLEQILDDKSKLNIKTVLTIASQVLDILQYIHHQGYIHSDIKAANILLGRQQINKRKKTYPAKKKNEAGTCRMRLRTNNNNNEISRRTRIRNNNDKNLRPLRNVNYLDDVPNIGELSFLWEDSTYPYKGRPKNLRPVKSIIYIDDTDTTDDEEYEDYSSDDEREKFICKPDEPFTQVYLVDFGLAAKYVGSDGIHKDYCKDERKAHTGTVVFCSRDAHRGVISRRSDLESLAFNMIYWLTGTLPWIEDVFEPELTSKKKNKFFANLEEVLETCFKHGCPKFIQDFFSYISQLEFDSEPDYVYCKNMFLRAYKEFGYKNDGVLDFDNLEGWGCKQKKIKGRENKNRKSPRNKPDLFVLPCRIPLNSNNASFIKPLLRKKVKLNKMNSMMNWSKILMDPEEILKQANKGKKSEVNEADEETLDINQLNPTYAMLEVFMRYKEKNGASPSDKEDCIPPAIEGYTAAMMAVYIRMKERESMEQLLRSKKSSIEVNRRRKRLRSVRSSASCITISDEESKPKKVCLKPSYTKKGSPKGLCKRQNCRRRRMVSPVQIKKNYHLRS